ncbi:MAG TPA: hypothetical protein VHW96_24110 [Solirubrobacteraceae bacterium]|jgi:hypothetical protein|nr:hypothetical protein [Solirubrobacteraceae bacterium]
MPHSGVAEFREDRSPHDERVAARNAARAALLQWDAREREMDARDRERLSSSVRALDDWSTSEHEASDWSAEDAPAPVDHTVPERDAVAPAEWSPSGGVPGRRTVTIRGQVADRYATPRPSSRRRPERRYERSGFRPDRAALWAVLLGMMLILAAVTSAHAATLHTLAQLH